MAIPHDRVLKTYKIIYSHEGDYTSINCDDNGAVSIGKIQWHANRALYLMRKIINKMGIGAAYELSYQQLVDEIMDESTSWSYRIFSSADARWTYPLLGTEESRSVQDAQAYSDILGYLEHAESLGVTEENAQIFMADIENQGGWGASDRIIKAAEGKDIDSLYIAASKDYVFQHYMGLRQRVYRQLMGYDFEDRPDPVPGSGNVTVEDELPAETESTAEGVEFVTGRLPELGGDDSWENLERYLHAHKTELNHIIEAIYTKIGSSRGYENGQTNGWEWRRFSDGTVECWRTVKCENVNCGIGWGPLLISADYGGIKYPFNFKSRPVQFLSLSSGDKGYMLGYPNGNGSATTSNTGKWWFVRGSGVSGTETVNVDIFVRGRLR